MFAIDQHKFFSIIWSLYTRTVSEERQKKMRKTKSMQMWWCEPNRHIKGTKSIYLVHLEEERKKAIERQREGGGGGRRKQACKESVVVVQWLNNIYRILHEIRIYFLRIHITFYIIEWIGERTNKFRYVWFNWPHYNFSDHTLTLTLTHIHTPRSNVLCKMFKFIHERDGNQSYKYFHLVKQCIQCRKIGTVWSFGVRSAYYIHYAFYEILFRKKRGESE